MATLSSYKSKLVELNQLLNDNIDNVLLNPDFIGKMEEMFEISENFPLLGEYSEKYRTHTQDDLIAEYKAFSDEEKDVVKELMKFHLKVAIIQNQENIEARKDWVNKLESL